MIDIKRKHGLGNIFMLLPVLNHLAKTGERITVETNTSWIPVLSAVLPDVEFTDRHLTAARDLDAETKDLIPREHRTAEFARLFSITEEIPGIEFTVPPAWSDQYRALKDPIIFAPEAGHPSRLWSASEAMKLARSLAGSPLVLTGIETLQRFECDYDLRGKQSLEDLIGLLSIARCLITMDSGTLHAGMLVNCPAVALFTSIDPLLRITEYQRVLVLRPSLHCSPCNKIETCEGRFECTAGITSADVLRAVNDIPAVNKRRIVTV